VQRLESIVKPRNKGVHMVNDVKEYLPSSIVKEWQVEQGVLQPC
jgi:hypothetical protein